MSDIDPRDLKPTGKTGMYVNPIIVSELPPELPRKKRTLKGPHYKVVRAGARALAVAQASPDWTRLARYNSQQDAIRSAHKLRHSKIWGGIGTLETAYRVGDDGKWFVYARYALPLALTELDLTKNIERLNQEYMGNFYTPEVDGEEINVVTGASLQVLDPDPVDLEGWSDDVSGA